MTSSSLQPHTRHNGNDVSCGFAVLDKYQASYIEHLYFSLLPVDLSILLLNLGGQLLNLNSILLQQ